MKKVIMISGANRGIGKAIVLKLYDHGFYLSLGIRSLDKIPVDILELQKDRVLCALYDALDPETEKEWIKKTVEAFHRIDGLVNNAGVYQSLDIEDDNEALLDTLIDINTKAPVRLARLALPYLRQSGQGRIINIASIAAVQVKDSVVGYSISKFGFLAASNAMLHAAKKDGVRVTALCPAWVNTDMASTADYLPEAMIQPETIADMVFMLLNLPNTAVIPQIIIENT